MKVKQSCLVSLLFASSLAAQPQGFHLAAGNAHPPVLDAQGNMVIQSGSKAIVNWDSFSIAASEQIHFQMQGSDSSILNRVIGTQGSDLFGLLSSNGKVFLINPNGVFIGPGGRIETADFLASTFDVLDLDFLQENDLLFCGDSTKSIQNLGTISCPRGNIHLFAAHVVNEGELKALQGNVHLAAGGDILLKKDGTSHIYIRPELAREEIEGSAIDNQGSIDAMIVTLQAGDSPYAKAIRSSGRIEATTVQQIGGEIYLVAEKGIAEVDGGSLTAAGGTIHLFGEKVGLQNHAKIDVSAPSGGGTVLIGGDLQGGNPEIQNAAFTYLSKESLIQADALENGNGGKIIVWGDEMTFSYGNISARGGKMGGDGGFVEVSGKYLDYQAFADRSAPKGQPGTLLLDPVNITITNAAGNTNANFVGPGYTYTGVCPNAIILSNSQLVTHLNAGNVVIDTSIGACPFPPTAGTITVTNDIGVTNPWTSATTLTLNAASSIFINNTISNTSPTTTPFDAMIFTANGTNSASNGITVAGALSCSNPGNIHLTGTGGTGAVSQEGVSITRAISTQGSIFITGHAGGNGTGGSNLGIQNSGIGTISAGTAGSSASITFTGTGGNGTTGSGGVAIDAAVTLLGTGSINFINCSGGLGTTNNSFAVLVSANGAATGSCTATQGTINFSNCIGGTSPTTNYGVFINTSHLSALDITATGIVGGSGNTSSGFFATASTIGTASTQSISISATATGAGANNDGIFLPNTTVQAGGSGAIVLNGAGSGGAGGNGVSLQGSGTITNVNGDISITGTGTQVGGTSPGIFIANGTTVHCTGTGNIFFNASSPNAIGIGTNTIATTGGNITFNGALQLYNSATLTAGGSGSVFFSSTIDSNFHFSPGPFSFTVDAGGSVTFSGAIGSAFSIGSLTVQPGSGFSTSPTLGTIPNGTVTFGGPSITATGAISLSAAGRAMPMSIATLIGTGDLTMTAGSLTMGVNESMTVLGNFTINSTGALSISDIVAAGTLNLTGSSITLNPQPPANYLGLGGFFYTSPSAHIIAQNTPVVSPSVIPAGSRILASGFSSEAAFLQQLKTGTTVLNYDIHGVVSAVPAAINRLVVANAQLTANYPEGLIPLLSLRYFPIYAICRANLEEPCSTGVFVPFIYESDIIDGNIFRSL